jgi:hypothetical protein
MVFVSVVFGGLPHWLAHSKAGCWENACMAVKKRNIIDKEYFIPKILGYKYRKINICLTHWGI